MTESATSNFHATETGYGVADSTPVDFHADAAPIRGLYLFHFEPRYRHAQHYLGYSDDIERRVREHLRSLECSSPLVRAVLRAGSTVTLVRIWPEGSRGLERRLKRQGSLSRHCPVCRARGEYHR